MKLVYDKPVEVSRWYARQVGDDSLEPTVLNGIGVEKDGEIVAAVVFDGVEHNNVYVHIASTLHHPPSSLLAATARYVYDQVGAGRMTFLVDEQNTRCVRFIRAMGAEEEGRLKKAQGDRDTLIFVLWKYNPLHLKLIETGRL